MLGEDRVEEETERVKRAGGRRGGECDGVEGAGKWAIERSFGQPNSHFGRLAAARYLRFMLPGWRLP